jgi:hypothetical protein
MISIHCSDINEHKKSIEIMLQQTALINPIFRHKQIEEHVELPEKGVVNG